MEYGHGNLQIYTKSLQSNLHGLQMKDKQDYTCCCYGCNTRDWPIVCQLYGLGDIAYPSPCTIDRSWCTGKPTTDYSKAVHLSFNKKQHITYT